MFLSEPLRDFNTRNCNDDEMETLTLNPSLPNAFYGALKAGVHHITDVVIC